MSTNASTTTGTLTERYVHEVVRRVPAGARDEVAEELRTAIADTIEGARAADPASAEREALSDMGDPIRLAARYADQPLTLIGPDLFPAYRRLLKILLATVLPVVTAAVIGLDVLDGKHLGEVIESGIGTVVVLGSQMIAWPTAVFALVERSRYRARLTARSNRWTPDDLPDLPPQEKHGLAGAAFGAVGNALLLGLIVWQHSAKPYTAHGKQLEILDPALWSGWIWPVVAGLAALTVLNLARAAAGRWTMPLATGYAVAKALYALPLAWIFHHQTVFDQEFLTDFNRDWTTPDSFYTAVAVGLLAVAASSAVSRIRQAAK
ncbi:HAAS signaling domain-containing protein [Streptomyces hiroshimensis]|uniref:Uncharacterized protein n=1 Tax=Streptomyces hiroshimensis TaxID=66424 RepID=A0ABQ2Y3M3_9ACTN|nr:hypothetical protein [Streptomyces hiroshimensis]GGX62149.1 hypothetical protein GCM10010324_03570 [Streptomyces hiroshimensis]